jgi:nucleotide-binding universal stress UspA family protein
MTQTNSPRIVVGYDGSHGADGALTWAVKYAEDRGGDIELTAVWQWPMSFGYALDLGEYSPETDATRMVEKAAANCGLPADRVRTVVLEGPAGAQLVDHAHGAAVLVVGTRGHNDFSEILLGSVSNYCVHHADCTVVVVRDVKPDA